MPEHLASKNPEHCGFATEIPDYLNISDNHVKPLRICLVGYSK